MICGFLWCLHTSYLSISILKSLSGLSIKFICLKKKNKILKDFNFLNLKPQLHYKPVSNYRKKHFRVLLLLQQLRPRQPLLRQLLLPQLMIDWEPNYISTTLLSISESFSQFCIQSTNNWYKPELMRLPLCNEHLILNIKTALPLNKLLINLTRKFS